VHCRSEFVLGSWEDRVQARAGSLRQGSAYTGYEGVGCRQPLGFRVAMPGGCTYKDPGTKTVDTKIRRRPTTVGYGLGDEPRDDKMTRWQVGPKQKSKVVIGPGDCLFLFSELVDPHSLCV